MLEYESRRSLRIDSCIIFNCHGCALALALVTGSSSRIRRNPADAHPATKPAWASRPPRRLPRVRDPASLPRHRQPGAPRGSTLPSQMRTFGTSKAGRLPSASIPASPPHSLGLLMSPDRMVPYISCCMLLCSLHILIKLPFRNPYNHCPRRASRCKHD